MRAVNQQVKQHPKTNKQTTTEHQIYKNHRLVKITPTKSIPFKPYQVLDRFDCMLSETETKRYIALSEPYSTQRLVSREV